MPAQTYLLIHPNSQAARMYLEFASTEKALTVLLQRFEAKLSELNPKVPKVTYELRDLYSWIDGMHEMYAFVPDLKTDMYHKRDRGWIKSALHQLLQQQARTR